MSHATLDVEGCGQVRTGVRLLMLKEVALNLLDAAAFAHAADHETDISLRMIHDQSAWLVARLTQNAAS